MNVETDGELTEPMEESETNHLNELRKDANKMFSNRRMLSYIRNLVMITHEMAKVSMLAYFAGDYLSRKQELLEKTVLTILEKTHDLPKASELKQLKKMSKQLTNMDTVFQKIKDQMTNRPTDNKTETKIHEESEKNTSRKKNLDEATKEYAR